MSVRAEFWTHTHRYLCWAAAGAVLLAVPVFGGMWWRGGLWWRNIVFENRDVWLLAALCSVGAWATVFVRAAVGLVTGWPPRVADRAVLVWTGRFFAGFLLGILVVAAWSAATTPPPGRRPRFAGGLTFTVLTVLGGAVAMVLTGWVVRRRRGWLLLPVAWAAALAAIVGVGLAAAA